MYHSSLAKKLKPVKRAWRGLTGKLQAKLHTLNIPKTIKTTTRRLLSFCSQHLFTPFKKRFLTKPASRRRYPYSYQYQQQHHQDHHNQNLLLQKNFAAVYIDHLYQPEPLSSSSSSGHAKHFHAETSTSATSKQAAVEEKSVPAEKEKSAYSTIEDAWNAIVAKSPQLRGVDERAEEFIYKFREDMKIQRERSLLGFQEMLDRSSGNFDF